MELEALVTLIMSNQWIAFGAILIGLCVRLLKMQRIQKLIQIPSRYLPLVALLFGQAQAVLEWIVAGQDPMRAVVKGLLATALAVTAHETLVESLLGGRELGRTSEMRGAAKAPSEDSDEEEEPSEPEMVVEAVSTPEIEDDEAVTPREGRIS